MKSRHILCAINIQGNGGQQVTVLIMDRENGFFLHRSADMRAASWNGLLSAEDSSKGHACVKAALLAIGQGQQF